MTRRACSPRQADRYHQKRREWEAKKLAVYKRGDFFWYEFQFAGEHVWESAKTRNKNIALKKEAAHRVRLSKGEVEPRTVPTLAEFAPRFESEIETVCADKPATVGFYKEKLRRLLADPDLANARLDAIEKGMVDAYKQRRSREPSRYGRPLAPASVNRELATLRRILRLAHAWEVVNRVPKITLLRGERNREFVLSHSLESKYLEAAPQPLHDVATLILETGMRPGEAVHLRWADVYLNPAVHAKFGYVAVRKGKSKNAKRNLSLTARAAEMLKAPKESAHSEFVFPGKNPGTSMLGTYLDRLHDRVRQDLELSDDFVVHSLRHTMLTRLGEAGADAFTIMKIAGHSSVTVSQRYVHPTPEGMERAFERLEDLNATKFAQEGSKIPKVPTKVPTVRRHSSHSSSQVVAIKRAGP
jgi:integrase